MILGTNHPKYLEKLNRITGKFNGAYYYALEIESNIIPRVKTNRNWNTIKIDNTCLDHSIVFVHRNVDLEKTYNYLKDYEDLVLVCSNYETQKFMQRYGKAIFLPLSVDVDYVKQFKTEKTLDACYAGNMWRFKRQDISKYVPKETHCLTNIPREELLREVAKYKTCYAIGRTAIEAKILGCEIKVCDSRYLDTSFWEIIDNKEASKILQRQLDEIDFVGE